MPGSVHDGSFDDTYEHYPAFTERRVTGALESLKTQECEGRPRNMTCCLFANLPMLLLQTIN